VLDKWRICISGTQLLHSKQRKHCFYVRDVTANDADRLLLCVSHPFRLVAVTMEAQIWRVHLAVLPNLLQRGRVGILTLCL